MDVVYFKGAWETKFSPSATSDAPFYCDSDRTVTCKMMSGTGKFRRGSYFPDCEFVELPYRSGSFSMLVLLPSMPDGLESLEAKLTPENISRWRIAARLDEEAIYVQLPKFKFKTTVALAEILAGMGAPDVFDGHANLSGIDGTTNLYVSSALHEAFVEVNEEGTTAGALTHVNHSTKGSPYTFRADHPFVFLVRDNRTGVILFLGRVSDPTQA